jgi:hypothetical protein
MARNVRIARARKLTVAGVLVGLACMAAPLLVVHYAWRSRLRVLSYPSTAADHLTEELALRFAQRALADSCDSQAGWRPVVDDRAKAPDRFLVRNTINADDGNLLFRSADSKSVRFVGVTVVDKKVEVRVTPGQ